METEENDNMELYSSKFKNLLEHIVPSDVVTETSRLNIYFYYIIFSLFIALYFIFSSIKNILTLRFRRIKNSFVALKYVDKLFKDHFKI